jgi:hypothetical protein
MAFGVGATIQRKVIPVIVTAKIKCASKTVRHDEKGDVHSATVSFNANYRDANGDLINQEWADATPALNLTMTLNGKAAAFFDESRNYELHIVPD